LHNIGGFESPVGRENGNPSSKRKKAKSKKDKREDKRDERYKDDMNDLDMKRDYLNPPAYKYKRWEWKWVRQPNVLQYGQEMWLRKWVPLQIQSDSYYQPSLVLPSHSSQSSLSNNHLPMRKTLKDSIPKKYVCPYINCSKIFLDACMFLFLLIFFI
jgi:hypothetical protein